MLDRREFIFGLAASVFGSCNPAAEQDNQSGLESLLAYARKCNVFNPRTWKYEPFNPRPYQVEYFKKLLAGNFVCKKCRQCGASTMNLIYAHWMAATEANTHVVFVTPSENMKQEISVMFSDRNVFEQEMTDGSDVVFLSPHEFNLMYRNKFISSIHLNNAVLILDEAAFIFNSCKLTKLDVRRMIDTFGCHCIISGTPMHDKDVVSTIYEEADETNRMLITMS